MSLIHMGVIGVLTVKVVMIDISVHSLDFFEQAQVDRKQDNHHSHNQVHLSSVLGLLGALHVCEVDTCLARAPS